MQELLLSFLVWIGANTDYNVDIPLPNVAFTDTYNVCAVYGIQDKGQCQAAKLFGFYNKQTTIYLKNSYKTNNKIDHSNLMHELIHYVQWANGKHQHTCLGHLELEAYQMQDRWLVENNLQKRLDPFKAVMLEASCDA